MSLYSKAAILAVQKVLQDKDIQGNVRVINEFYLRKVWEASVSNFTNSYSSIEKCCPRNVFIGLVLCGHIKGLEYLNNGYFNVNYNYVKEGIKIIKKLKSLNPNSNYIEIVNNFKENDFFVKIEGTPNNYNSQIHVLFALIRKEYINFKNQ